MILDYFAKRRARKTFSQYVSSDVVDKILDGSPATEAELRMLTEKQIEFVCVEVRGETAAIISERMGLVSDLACKHDAVVDSMVSGLIVIIFGLVHSDKADHKGLLAALQNEFKTDIRLVYGSGLAACGNLGSSSRMSFSFVLPGFIEALSSLATLPFGQTLEWKGRSPTMPSSESSETLDR